MTDHDAIAARVRQDRRAGTPGPWRVGPVDDTIVSAADGSEVAAVDGDYNEPDLWPIMEANARRIATLPDLEAAYLDLYDEVKRLRAHVLDQNAEMHKTVQDRVHWQTRCEAAHESEGRLMAERDRLRAALTNALDACRIVDAAAKEGHDRIGDLVLHMLSAVEPARVALKGDSDE